MRERLCTVYREFDEADPRTHAHKLPVYASGYLSCMYGLASQAKHCLGRPSAFAAYMQLELSRHVLYNIARFRLRAGILYPESLDWLLVNTQ